MGNLHVRPEYPEHQNGALAMAPSSAVSRRSGGSQGTRWFPRDGSLLQHHIVCGLGDARGHLQMSEGCGQVWGEKVKDHVIDSGSWQFEEPTSGRGRRRNLRGSRAESAPMCKSWRKVLS